MSDSRLESILATLEATEKRKMSLEQLAGDIANTIILLFGARHDAEKEREKAERIEKQIEATTAIEIRDVAYLKHLIEKLVLASQKRQMVNDAAEKIMKDLLAQEAIIKRIERIIADKSGSQYGNLQALIKDLLYAIKQTAGAIESEEKEL